MEPCSSCPNGANPIPVQWQAGDLSSSQKRYFFILFAHLLLFYINEYLPFQSSLALSWVWRLSNMTPYLPTYQMAMTLSLAKASRDSSVSVPVGADQHRGHTQMPDAAMEDPEVGRDGFEGRRIYRGLNGGNGKVFFVGGPGWQWPRESCSLSHSFHTPAHYLPLGVEPHALMQLRLSCLPQGLPVA